jgi:hypothetical protein
MPAGDLPDGQIKCTSRKIKVQPLDEKYSDFPKQQINPIIGAVSSHSRGVSRSSRTRGGMRWTRIALLTRALEADGEVVWSIFWHSVKHAEPKKTL